MIARDFIMRMVQMLFDAIAKVLQRDVPGVVPDIPQIQRRFNEMYNQFFHRPAEHYYVKNKEEILVELENEGYSEPEMFAIIQMLSELIYQDALIKNNFHEKFALLEKSLFLLEYLDRNSSTFSWDRGQKIAEIRKAMDEVNTSDLK